MIGRLCSQVPASRAPEVIFGYTCVNDVTARDPEDGRPVGPREGLRHFCPLGPWIETELDPTDFRYARRRRRGRQDGRTTQMIHDIPSWSNT